MSQAKTSRIMITVNDEVYNKLLREQKRISDATGYEVPLQAVVRNILEKAIKDF